jgi:ATP-dependent Clp protease, protease subunit
MGNIKIITKELFIGEYINQESVGKTIEKITEINLEDDEIRRLYGDKCKIKPISLFINSYGGSVYDGFALINALLNSTTPVNTICIGSAMSMAFIIFLCGKVKIMGQYSTLMYHECSQFVWDKLEGVKLKIEEAGRLQAMMDHIVISNSKITQDELNDIKKRKAEWYIDIIEANRLGLMDRGI